MVTVSFTILMIAAALICLVLVWKTVEGRCPRSSFFGQRRVTATIASVATRVVHPGDGASNSHRNSVVNHTPASRAPSPVFQTCREIPHLSVGPFPRTESTASTENRTSSPRA
jgi:hypothetical protein